MATNMIKPKFPSPVDDSEEFISEVLHQKVLHEINEHLTKRPKVNQQESPDKVLNLVRNFLLLSGILALVKKFATFHIPTILHFLWGFCESQYQWEIVLHSVD